jgi:hypothetical protein
MTASKKVRHVVQFCILFLFPFLSLATGTGKGDTSKEILLCEGSGPRALLLIRGSKAGPSEGFDSRLRALGLRAHYWSEVRRLTPRKGSITASGHSGSAPTTGQRFEGWPPKGSTAASEHAERGMTLGTSDTWPRLGLRSRGTLGHFRDQKSDSVTKSHQREASSPRTLSNGTVSGKSPAGTFEARLSATSRPLSNRARASTRITL